MNQGEILASLRRAVNAAQDALVSGNDDAWYAALHEIRERAWAGKEFIHAKRHAEAEANGLTVFGNPRSPVSRSTSATQSRPRLDVSTLEDILK